MRTPFDGHQLLVFVAGFLLLVIGMLIEFLLVAVIPGSLAAILWEQGVLLILVSCFFLSSVVLLRRALLGHWWYGYDYIIFVIAGIIFFAGSVMTVLGLQTGHPYLYLSNTNPLLMIVLWVFILPPVNPFVTCGLALSFFLLAGISHHVPLSPILSKSESKSAVYTESSKRWWIFIRITRVDVWLGSLFLVTLAFIILGGPPLSPPPFPLYQYSTWSRFLIALLAAALFNSCVFILNQLGDLDTDSYHQVKAKLPLSAGLLSQRQGVFLAMVILAVGVFLAFVVGIYFLLVLFATILFAVIYSLPPLRLKGRPFLDLSIIGLAFGSWAVLVAWTLLNFLSEVPLMLLVGSGLYYAGTHGIHTASDYPADAKAGIQTTAVVLGPKRTARIGIILISMGLLLLYAGVGFYTHLFWYGFLKFKGILLLIFCSLPMFALFHSYRNWQRQQDENGEGIGEIQTRARAVTYLLFLILLIYLLLHVFLFYPVYYPNYSFPWE